MARGSIRKFGARFGGRTPDLTTVVVAGANANTNIAVAGIKTTDQLVSVVELPGVGEAAGQVPVDRTAVTAITSAGNIQATVATNTSADRRLLVTYWSV
jgi:hypothetical protein